MTSIRITAPAKVNLFLKVLGKRKDGYHDVHIIFERISLADTITITKTHQNGISVSSNVYITNDPRKNLVYKAAEAILKHKKVKAGVKISIKKHIPIAAGLGGGSSDAAATLIGINKLFGFNISKKTLMQIAAKIGADVSFFILNTPVALGRGIGERLRPLKASKKLWHLLVYPDFWVSTKEVYGAFDSRAKKANFGLTRSGCDAKIHLPLKLPLTFLDMEAMLHNDLHEIVLSKKRVIGSVLKRLATLLGKKAIVSGSGPSVFCLCETRKEALRARNTFLRNLPARNRKRWQVFVVATS